MIAVAHNRLRGNALYVGVLELFRYHPAVYTNYEIRDALAASNGLPQEDAKGRHLLYVRVTRVTERLLQDGYLLREEAIGINKHVVYKYQFNPMNNVRH